MPSSSTRLSKAFDLWEIGRCSASPTFRRFCLQRFGKSELLTLALDCLPTNTSALWRDGVFRCVLWEEAAIKNVLLSRPTNRYMPIGTLGDGSWLALDLRARGSLLHIGTFPLYFCIEDEWTDLSSAKFRLLSPDYAEYLHLIYDDPKLDLLIGVLDHE